MAGDSISVYYGEFLTSPVPLELSFNFCSHKCAYCFANLNKPDRTADIAATMKLLAEFRGRTTFEAKLLALGYPIVCSNRVDPFAHSNKRQSLPVLRVMAESGIPIAIQTRGGDGAEEVAGFLPPSVWYVSISTLDDAIRKAVEPGAPNIQSRLDLIASLRSKGHRVVVGMNPAVPEWQPDADALAVAVRNAGAEGAWVETMHLSHRQISRMTDKERKAVTEPILSRAMKKTNRDDIPYFLRLRGAVQDAGMEVFSSKQPDRSEFFRPWRECYKKTFPILQDYINACYDDGIGTDCLIDVNDFTDFFASRLPRGVYPIAHYIGSTTMDLMRKKVVPHKGTFSKLLRAVYRNSLASASPMRCPAFAKAAKPTEKGWIEYTDNHGFPYLVFDGHGHDDDFFEWKEQERGA